MFEAFRTTWVSAASATTPRQTSCSASSQPPLPGTSISRRSRSGSCSVLVRRSGCGAQLISPIAGNGPNSPNGISGGNSGKLAMTMGNEKNRR
ncbi:hypothetical protein AB1Y20_019192 [Prymnesium parvum]|uniref:Uncharacterized protein n=1 Tax=Prymnesium parvum TaxID=97485 RepID=A0AB34JV29_PRYPA